MMRRCLQACLFTAGTLAALGFSAVAQALQRPSLAASRVDNERSVGLYLAEAIYHQRCADAYWFAPEPPCSWPPPEFGGRVLIALQGGQAWLYSTARSTCSRFEVTWDGLVRLRSTNACRVDDPKDALTVMLGNAATSTGRQGGASGDFAATIGHGDPFRNPITFPIVIDQFDSSQLRPRPYVQEVRVKGKKSPSVELSALEEYRRMYPSCRAKGSYPAVLDWSDRIYVILDGAVGCPTVAVLLQNNGDGSVSMPHAVVGPDDVQRIRGLMAGLRTISFEIR